MAKEQKGWVLARLTKFAAIWCAPGVIRDCAWPATPTDQNFFPEMSEWVPLARHRGEAATIAAASATTHSIMNDAAKRSILRWIHLVFSIPILGYIYSPFEEIPNYAPMVRYVAVPAIVLSGLWMWKGHLLGRRISKRSA